jgi:HTH-type transcriptional regulator, competence development regulator
MILGQRLKACRKAKKLTQQELSVTLGINRSTYAKYETGDNEPDNETLQKLADFFGVSVDYLLGRTDDPATIHKSERPLTELENLFFYELDKLSEEDKKKALEHVRYLRYLAEQENNKKK